jgi:hypothetical protein
VRLTLLLASTLLAAGFALSGCSTSGSSQAIPGGSSVAPMGHPAAHFVVVGAKHDTSCPSQYMFCVTLKKGKTTQEICYSSSGNCTSGIIGDWTWKSTIVNPKNGKKYRKIKAKFDPNPGNPVDIIYVVKKIKNTHGKVKWAQDIQICNVSNPSSCKYTALGLIGG